MTTPQVAPSPPQQQPTVQPAQPHIAVSSGQAAVEQKQTNHPFINKYVLITVVAFLFFISGLSFWIYVEFVMQ